MDIKVNGVVLRCADYNENDKILTLLTAEGGKLTAGIKGVKKAGAKLRFAAQPFCFAEFILARRGDKYTVINASEQESFYDLRTDINKFYAASAAAEAALSLTYEGDDCKEIFYEFIKALTEICNGSECSALIKFLTFALRQSGYAISLDKCAECGDTLFGKDKLRFDFDAGAFTCFECGTGAGASRVTYNVLRKLENKPYEEDFITEDGEKRALRLLREYFSYKLNFAFKSLSEYIRLL
ncbi:MAG: DNA repair protein RecO [Clostridia bacterium]|nr:DNA repair protein RecO [Clostridia bacterium]